MPLSLSSVLAIVAFMLHSLFIITIIIMCVLRFYQRFLCTFACMCFFCSFVFAHVLTAAAVASHVFLLWSRQRSHFNVILASFFVLVSNTNPFVFLVLPCVLLSHPCASLCLKLVRYFGAALRRSKRPFQSDPGPCWYRPCERPQRSLCPLVFSC